MRYASGAHTHKTRKHFSSSQLKFTETRSTSNVGNGHCYDDKRCSNVLILLSKCVQYLQHVNFYVEVKIYCKKTPIAIVIITIGALYQFKIYIF